MMIVRRACEVIGVAPWMAERVGHLGSKHRRVMRNEAASVDPALARPAVDLAACLAAAGCTPGGALRFLTETGCWMRDGEGRRATIFRLCEIACSFSMGHA